MIPSDLDSWYNRPVTLRSLFPGAELPGLAESEPSGLPAKSQAASPAGTGCGKPYESRAWMSSAAEALMDILYGAH
jgi:hypothetical protein